VQVDLQIDHSHRVVTLTITGELSDDGMLGLPDLIEKNPAITPDFSMLIDLRGASGRTITAAGVRALAARRLALAPGSRRAVIVPSMLGYGMARMYELLRGARAGAPRVFMDVDEAHRWIRTGAG
jgi:hypothetical protein